MRRRNILLVVILACFILGVAIGLISSAFAHRDNTQVKTPKTTTKKSETPAQSQPTSAPAQTPASFEVNNAMTHVDYLAGTIGLREEGTSAESLAADYISQKLVEYGYAPTTQAVPITLTQRNTQNVIAKLKGTVQPERTLVIGAHMDSKVGPGANDNATGCGVLLEMARVLRKNNKQVPTIEFVFFGGEEIASGGSRNNHHWGSRFFVSSLPAEEKKAIAGMISVDMVGAGPEFRARNMAAAPGTLTAMMLELGASRGMTFLQDTSDVGNSDHEPFEKAGIPSVWIEYRDFAAYHTGGDNVSSVDDSHVKNVGALLQEFLEGYLTSERLNMLNI